jgi:hypothetical protein
MMKLGFCGIGLPLDLPNGHKRNSEGCVFRSG